jgi:hypothetical protein
MARATAGPMLGAGLSSIHPIATAIAAAPALPPLPTSLLDTERSLLVPLAITHPLPLQYGEELQRLWRRQVGRHMPRSQPGSSCSTPGGDTAPVIAATVILHRVRSSERWSYLHTNASDVRFSTRYVSNVYV